MRFMLISISTILYVGCTSPNPFINPEYSPFDVVNNQRVHVDVVENQRVDISEKKDKCGGLKQLGYSIHRLTKQDIDDIESLGFPACAEYLEYLMSLEKMSESDRNKQERF